MGSVRPLWTHHRTGQTGCAHHLGSDFLGRRLKGQAKIPKVQLRPRLDTAQMSSAGFETSFSDSVIAFPLFNTGVRLEIEQIHLVIEWIIAVGVVSALKGAGKLDFFERVNGQNL